ncbi:MAG: glycosyltransferase family 4 protein [bacterium]|nr:glycosyltransferase family 4 protein [bacterium]
MISLEGALTKTSGAKFVHLIYGDRLFPKKLLLPFYLVFGFGNKIKALVSSCDIIHALDGWPYGFWAALLAGKYHKKLVITAVGTGGVKPLYGFLTKPLLAWAYRRANERVAVSRHTRDEILKVLPDLKIAVINHGVDAEKYKVLGMKYSVLEQRRPYILSVGAWKRRKGLENSIKAFDLLRAKFPGLKYLILSKPPEEIRKKYSQVTFVSGFSEEELAALYKNAELFILLPQDDRKDIEGFGLAYLEAAAAGLPVIGSKGTSAEDAILDGRNGFLVDGQNPQAAAVKMEKILVDMQLRDEMSGASSEFAKTMSWEKAAGSYSEIYRQVLK